MLRNQLRRVADKIEKLSRNGGFHTNQYLRHTARCLEHLASLPLEVRGMRVLEVGAGIGDHSSYYMDRECSLTITEVRNKNLAFLRRRYPRADIQFLDMDHPQPLRQAPFDLVHCYGLLYHLQKPAEALAFLGDCCEKLLLLETCVSFGDQAELHFVKERRIDRTQAFSGVGCRPTRAWVFAQLQNLFEFVYVPRTQPNHENFPLDWTAPEQHGGDLNRAVFIASRQPLDNDLLVGYLPARQVRHVPRLETGRPSLYGLPLLLPSDRAPSGRRDQSLVHSLVLLARSIDGYLLRNTRPASRL